MRRPGYQHQGSYPRGVTSMSRGSVSQPWPRWLRSRGGRRWPDDGGGAVRKTRTNHRMNQHRGGVAPRAGGLSALSRAVLALVLASLSLLSVGLARPAPTARAAVIGSSSRFGLVADVGTRYGIYRQQNRPIDLLAQTGAKWVV